mmetsp:Transcript_810/g.1221  ORF Transcript_810/g.1221 Transcript_810/m.1221 type:complete len:169 (+) Transcript_810:166-672(+)
MLIWMLLHRGVYFWVRAIFQMLAFSFLIVTLLMLINFGDGYWHSTLSVLVVKHCLNMIAYTIELMAFSMRKLDLIKYKLMLDVISIALIIAVQVRLFTAHESDYLDGSSATLYNDLSQAEQVKRWVSMEVGLFYIGVLGQLIFLICIACKVNSEQFQDDYYFALRGQD